MKYLLISLAILCLAAPGVYSQILNGGFEVWTDGKPDDWVVQTNALSGFSDEYVIDSSSNQPEGTFSFNYSAIGAFRVGVSLSNSTSNHPKGSFFSKNITILSFWYRSGWGGGGQYENFMPLTVSISGEKDTTFAYTNSWERVIIPLRNSLDSIKIQFEISAEVTHGTVGVSLSLDNIKFETTSEVTPVNFLSSSISISSNPIFSHAYIKYHSDGNIFRRATIFDLTGREVMKLPSLQSASGEGSIPFDVDELPNGLYYLRFEAGGKVEMKKIIVQH